MQTIKLAILGLLSWRPLTGYDIKMMFAGATVLHWSGNNNQIYKTLVELHRADLVSLQIDAQAHGPVRKVYTITPKGQAELKARVAAPPEPPQLRHPLLVQLAWTDQLEAPDLDALLAGYEAEIGAQVEMLKDQEHRQDIAPSGRPREAYIHLSQARTPREAYLWSMIFKHWIAFYENELQWVRELRRGLSAV